MNGYAEQTLGKDRAFFLALLRRFLDDYGDCAEAIAADLARGERDTATRRLHTLRSNAGNLGALTLAHSALALETVLFEQAGLPDAEIDAFCVALSALVTAGRACLRRSADVSDSRPAAYAP